MGKKAGIRWVLDMKENSLVTFYSSMLFKFFN